MKFNCKLNILTGVFLLFFSMSGFATVNITNVKGDRVLIEFAPQDGVFEKQSYFAIDTTGKKVGIVDITKIRGNQAVGSIQQGKIQIGNSLELRSGSAHQTEIGTTVNGDVFQNMSIPLHWGFMGAMEINTFQSPAGSQNVTMTGNSFAAKSFVDYQYDKAWSILGDILFENFSASGTSNNCSGGVCNASINYLGGDVIGKYHLTRGTFRYWVGGGLNFEMVAGGSSNIVSVSQGQFNQKLLLSFGTDIYYSKKNFIPIHVDYAYHPAINSVSSNQFIIWLGFAWPLHLVF